MVLASLCCQSATSINWNPIGTFGDRSDSEEERDCLYWKDAWVLGYVLRVCGGEPFLLSLNSLQKHDF